GVYSLGVSECWVLEFPSSTSGDTLPFSRDRGMRSSLALRPRAIPMDERDYRDNDPDSPTIPGSRLPGDGVGAGALTPPPLSNAPLSDAPTLPQGTPLPGASPALPSARPAPPSTSNISAFQGLRPGVLFGGRYEILNVLGQGAWVPSTRPATANSIASS